MSNRQVSRINQALHLRELDELNKEDSEEEEQHVKSKPIFTFNEDSSESEEEETESLQLGVIQEKVAASAKPGEADKDDIAFLDSLAENGDAGNGPSCETQAPAAPSVFITDPKSLDLDKVLNDKFSRNNFMRQVELQEGGVGGKKKSNQNSSKGVMRKNLLASHRHYLFGAPKEDWTKPPSFIGGGMQMLRTSDSTQPHISHFSVQWSSEYQRTNELYQLIQNTGDVNRLVMFLANYPYHIEGLLQLSMVFARLGLMDRSSDLVRRALYCFECTFPESFKPCTGLCRMNPLMRENGFLFQALYKHMQHCFTLGCHHLTVDLCRLMLSLDPADRSHSILLTLDYYLLQAASYDMLQSYAYGDSNADGTVIELTDFTTHHWPSPYCIGSSTTVCGGVSNADSPHVPTLADLPNWWYSVALSHYLSELDSQRKQAYGRNGTSTDSSSGGSGSVTSKNTHSFVVPSSSSRHAVSSFMLKCALLRYPFMLTPLLSKAGVTTGLFTNATWKPVLNHSYFSTNSYLRNVSQIYSHRVGAMWNTPEIHVWILEAAKDVIRVVDGKANTTEAVDHTAHYAKLSSNGVLSQYASAKLDDFTEEVVRMPNDMNNLIDAQLMDPRVLAGGVRFNAEQMGVELPRNRPRMNRFEREQLELRRQEEQRNIIDLTMPLMELFFVTLIPWYRMPGSVR